MSAGPAVATRALVAGIGYRNLRDHSAGPLLVDELGALGGDVDVEDLSYSPIDVLFQLQARPPYDVLYVVAAHPRGDDPGTVRRRAWTSEPPAPDDVVGSVNESLVGIVSHLNLLRVLSHFGALPPRTVVYEIEPGAEGWGPEVSAPVREAMRAVADEIRRELAR